MVTGSRELIREMNRRLVLETVINDGPLSRAAISKKLGLTKATISAIVQDLLEEQYIEEIGSDQTQYGRKPILLQFCRQNGYIIALDLGVERTVLMVCDLLGQNCRLHQYNCPLERDTSIDFLLQLIRNQIRLLPATPFGVVGIGIGIHGTHDPASIGTCASEGCIRLQNENLKKLKDYAKVGMQVKIEE